MPHEKLGERESVKFIGLTPTCRDTIQGEQPHRRTSSHLGSNAKFCDALRVIMLTVILYVVLAAIVEEAWEKERGSRGERREMCGDGWYGDVRA